MTGIVAFGNKDVKDKFSDKMLTDDRHGIMGSRDSKMSGIVDWKVINICETD